MDYSRKRQCDSVQGGANELYIFPFVEYNESQIIVENNILVNFPYNIIYNLEAFNISFDEKVTDFYEQKISFQVKKILYNDFFKEYSSRDYRIIIRDNNDNYRLIGLYTGLSGSFDKKTGGNKSDFNGYSFSYETKEEDTAPFLLNLDKFSVMNLEDLGLIDGNGNYIQDGNSNKIAS